MRDTNGTCTADPAGLARRFQALADENRIRVLELLGESELCVCELAEALELSQPLLSFHLRTLREAGLVQARRRGRWAYYSLKSGSIRELEEFTEAIATGGFVSGDERGVRARDRCCRARTAE